MISNVGSTLTAVRTTGINKPQKNFEIKNTISKQNDSSEAPSPLFNSCNTETNVKALYASEQISTYLRTTDDEALNAIEEQNKPPRCDLTKEELTAIQDELAVSDDPRKYYEAAFVLLNKGVLAGEDLPKTFEMQKDSGEATILAGGYSPYDPEKLEPPEYVEDFVKTILVKLSSKLEVFKIGLDEKTSEEV